MTTAHHDSSEETYSKTILGFWLYLMTDCILFATFFAAYAVLQYGSDHAPFNLPLILIETLILLTSSFACGPLQLAVFRQNKAKTLAWLSFVLLLGAAFFVLVMMDFVTLCHQGNDWKRNGFYSAYFTLVGILLTHIAFGLLWMKVLMVQILKRGITTHILRRITCLRLFWHFLNVVWVFIFAIVYMMGAL